MSRFHIKKWLGFSMFGIAAASFAAVDIDTTPETLQHTLNTVYQDVKPIRDGMNASYIPELAKVNPLYFGIAIVTVDGKVYSVGDADVPFAIESIAKPFMYSLALQDNGEAFLTKNIGLNATGQKFNSVLAIEQMPNHIENPLVNAGAIQVASTIKGKDSDDKWKRMFDYLQSFGDGKLTFGDAVYRSETGTNDHNQAIAKLLQSYSLMFDDPMQALDRYTKECSVMVTAKQLALMGATLANKGVNPMTHKRVADEKNIQHTLSMMTVAGLYENSGAWWFSVGLPGKSGVGGGILAIVPGKMAIVTFAPPLDESGNSVKGLAAMAQLSQLMKLHVLAETLVLPPHLNPTAVI